MLRAWCAAGFRRWHALHKRHPSLPRLARRAGLWEGERVLARAGAEARDAAHVLACSFAIDSQIPNTWQFDHSRKTLRCLRAGLEMELTSLARIALPDPAPPGPHTHHDVTEGMRVAYAVECDLLLRADLLALTEEVTCCKLRLVQAGRAAALAPDPAHPSPFSFHESMRGLWSRVAALAAFLPAPPPLPALPALPALPSLPVSSPSGWLSPRPPT